jgi:hypothetical protein
MDWLKENWFKLGIIGVLLLAAFPVYYHYVIYIPNRDEAARVSEIAKESKLRYEKLKADIARDNCILQADKDYSADWDRQCQHAGRNHKDKDCTLPSSLAKQLEDRRNYNQEKCYKEYAGR